VPSSPYVAIPDPSDDTGNHTECLSTLKQNVEILLGILGSRGWANQTIIYRAKDDREPTPVGSKNGDRRLIPPLLAGETWVESVWYNGAWRVL
jgi:hypothetical protein